MRCITATFILVAVLTTVPARIASAASTEVSVDYFPTNPFPGTTVTFVIRGVSLLGCGPRNVRATIVGRTIHLEAETFCGACLATSSPFLVTTTVQIPSGLAAAGSYAVEYAQGPCNIGQNNGPSWRSTLVVSSSTRCQADAFTLCLSASRFEVTAKWKTPSGFSGVARTIPLSDGSGSFWFFDPDNSELLVKVISACSTSEPMFWFFAAGLTNVGVDVTVKDTKTGLVKTYSNPAGVSFSPIFDTNAFACN